LEEAQMEKRDLIIIGGGVGGLVTASVTAQLGLDATLIEARDKLGGDCLHYGCVPSKCLIQAGRVASTIKRSAEFGIDVERFDKVDLERVNDRVREVIETIQQHDDPERFRRYGCEVLFGKAQFTGPATLRFEERLLTAKHFVIATGSSPFIPDIDGLEQTGYQTNETIFSLQHLPERLVVIGGGPIGVELAQSYARLGSNVTVIQRGPLILPHEEPEASRLLQHALQEEGITIVTNATLQSVGCNGPQKHLSCLVAGSEKLIVCDEILLAVGRRPNVDDLGLEVAGVDYSNRGITVDKRLRTTNKRIYACGDVVGPYQFTHMAEYQAGIIIANIAFRMPKKVDYRVVPWVTYSDPARVGFSEAQAKQQGLRFKVLHFDFKDIDRAITEHETTGLFKLIVAKGPRWSGGGRILGATILGPHAGELLHETVLAMKAGLRIDAISGAIHAYPTLSQVHKRVVNTYYGEQLFSAKTRALVKWLNKLF
jgi:pyruvate/2-oxoglutarate dehydrogenase complex dihydrolipoamide dehydrogenase (E3) component